MDLTPLATDIISVLRDHLLVHHPTWDVDLPGAGACILNATDNTQGRLINGVPAGSVCDTPASSYNGRFIHIEQDPDFRNPSDWINPVKDAWLAAPTNLTAKAGRRLIILNWNPSSGAQSYTVKRSTTNGGPYKTVASHVIKPAYINTGLSPGTTYYYVVTATNAAGESSNSNQASAKARF
jgi:fibronectin type III domain protein